jgi:uncharacterized membrane protein
MLFLMFVPLLPGHAAPATSTTATADMASTTAAGAQIVDTTQSTNNESNGQKPEDGTYERAIVTDVSTVTQNLPNGAQQLKGYQIQFLSGPMSGKARLLTSDISTNPYGIDPHKGDKVLVYVQPNPDGGEPLAYLEGFERRGAIYGLIALFVLTMVLLAGWQGFKIAFSIFLSIALIGLILIPSFLGGLNPVPIAFALIAVLATISSGFSIGWNRKSAVTIAGTLGGVVVAFVISYIFADWAHLSGLSTEEDRMFFDKNPNLNPRGLLFAGIAIASMGIVEDVAVSIASGVMEVRRANMRLKFKELFRSGMIIGRDHMGALANTLIFAYVGGSLSTLLLYTQYGGSWAKFLNFDSVVDEVIRSLAGTIGLIFTVPITALLAAWFALRIRSQTERVKEAQGWHGGHDHPHE